MTGMQVVDQLVWPFSTVSLGDKSTGSIPLRRKFVLDLKSLPIPRYM